MVLVAVAQLTSGSVIRENLAAASQLIARAAGSGARVGQAGEQADAGSVPPRGCARGATRLTCSYRLYRLGGGRQRTDALC